jgi:proteasome lid subunit RPN8/RPN11
MNYIALPTQQKIEELAREGYPKEICGYVIRKEDGTELVYPCANLYRKPTEAFLMNPDTYLDAKKLGEIICLYHSHPNSPAAPSDVDRLISEEMELPWLIYSWPDNAWSSYTPQNWEMPLVGRKFVHGIVDCYTLGRDYYKRVLGIELPDFYRENDWWEKGGNLYVENFEKCGFVRVNDLKVHDALLIQLVSPVPNHLAIVVQTETPMLVLHHVMNRLSCHQPLGGFWLKNHNMTLRHKSLL